MWWEDEISGEQRGRSASVVSLPPTDEGEWTRIARMGLDDKDEAASREDVKVNGYHNATARERSDSGSSQQPVDQVSLRTRSPSRLRSILGDCPLWRVTAAIDPMTMPLQLIEAWVIDVPARLSSAVVSFTKAHASKLGHKSKQNGWEDMRHLRTIRQMNDASARLQAAAWNEEGSGGESGLESESTPAPTNAKAARDGKGALLCALLCLRKPGAEEEDVIDLLRKEASFFSEENGPFPRIVKVPANAAPCKQRLREWSAYWSVSVCGSAFELASPETTNAASKMIDRQADKASWTPERLAWAKAGFKRCLDMARYAKSKGELPVGVHVTEDFDATAPAYFTPYKAQPTGEGVVDDSWRIETDAHDTRCSERNPIKHAVLNAIRNVAELRVQREKDREKRRLLEGIAPHLNGAMLLNGHRDGAASPGVAGVIAQHARLQEQKGSDTGSDIDALEVGTPSPPGTPEPQATSSSSAASANASAAASAASAAATPPRLANGQDYLLNSLILFTTHEPCAYCGMALVHSRVRAVYFLQPAPHAGGCCGAALSKPCEGMGDGGPYAVQEQSGLNHRFEVWRWMGDLQELGVSGREYEVDRMLEIHGLDP